MKSRKNSPGEAQLRFYEELSEFLPAELRKTQFACPLKGRITVRELLGTLKVPTKAVDLVLANGKSVGLSHLIGDGERLSFYPVFEAFDIGAVQRIRRRPLRRIRFAVDGPLKPLASALRGLGYDTILASDPDAKEFAGKIKLEGRIFLTQSSRRITRGRFSHALCLGGSTPSKQLAEVVARLHLAHS
jgi:hypothetical protein